MKKLLLAFALCFLTSCSYGFVDYEDRDLIPIMGLLDMDDERANQQEAISMMGMFGIMTEEEIDMVEEILTIELGHFLASQIAASENDEDRLEYHLEEREFIQDKITVLLDMIKERVEEAPSVEEAPPVKRQDL